MIRARLPVRGRLRLGLLAAPLALAWSAPALAAVSAPIDVYASHVTAWGTGRWLAARGGVVVHYEGGRVQADTVEVDRLRGRIRAWGHVRWFHAEGTGTARAVTLDTRTRRGRLDGAHIWSRDGAEFWGRRIWRLSPSEYRLEDGGFTPCRCRGEERAPWFAEAASAHVHWRESVTFRHAVLWVGGVPVLYLPVGYLPWRSERKSGLLLPRMGFSRRYGYTVQPGLFLALGPSADLTLWGDYTTLGGYGWHAEWRSVTRSGRHELLYRWFREAPDAPFLAEEERGPSLRWEVRGRIDEEPWGLFRWTTQLQLFSDVQQPADFSEDLETLTRTNATSQLLLSREWSGLGALLGRVGVSQALLRAGTTTGSRVPSLRLLLDPLRLGPLPLWIDGGLAYDRFYAYNPTTDTAQPWERRYYRREGERTRALARLGGAVDPLPGLLLRGEVGLQWQARTRDLYTEEETRTTLWVTDVTRPYARTELSWGLVGRNRYGTLTLAPFVGLIWLDGPDRPLLPIEDGDSVAPFRWTVAGLELRGRLGAVAWSYRYEYPFTTTGGRPTGLDWHHHRWTADATGGGLAVEAWRRGRRWRRIDGRAWLRLASSLQLELVYARTPTTVTTLPWSAAVPSPWLDAPARLRPTYQVGADLRARIWRVRAEASLKAQLPPYREPDLGLERGLGLGYDAPCRCLGIWVAVKDLPGTRADRLDVRIDLGAVGSAAAGP